MLQRKFSRRNALQAGAATTALLAAPAIVRAQDEPIKIGALNPLTGVGGNYGVFHASLNSE